jgi:primosomal protein N'
MQLLTCEACEHQVSPSARRCPNCGHSLKQFSKGALVGIVMCVFAALLFWFAYAQVQTRKREATEEFNRSIESTERTLDAFLGR